MVTLFTKEDVKELENIEVDFDDINCQIENLILKKGILKSMTKSVI